MQAPRLPFFDRYRDHALLVLRAGFGIMFMLHGWPKITGGPEKWAGIGGAMSNFGITFAPTFWGLMASLAEFVGGLLLVLGLLTRPACLALIMTMIVAATMHITKGDDFPKISHPIESGIVFLGLLGLGAGRFSLDHTLFGEPPIDDPASDP